MGSAAFTLEHQTLDVNTSIDVDVLCKVGEENLCRQENIKNIQIAMFTLDFTDVNMQVTGPAGKFRIRWFDRNNCHDPGSIYFTLDGENSFIKFKMEPKGQCDVVPANDYLGLRWMIDNVIVNQKEESLQSFQTQRPGMSMFSDTRDYVSQLTEYTISCKNLKDETLQKCVDHIKLQVRDQLSKFEIITTTKFNSENIDPTTGKILLHQYYQEVSSIFEALYADIEDGCYDPENNKITIFEGSMRRQITPGPLNNCSHKIFSRLYPYTNIRGEYGFVQNKDYSGTKQRFLLDYPGTTCPYDKYIDEFFLCDAAEDKERCERSLIEIRKMRSNSTVALTQYFQTEENDFVQSLSFPLIWDIPPVTQVDVSFIFGQICVTISNLVRNTLYTTKIHITNEHESINYEKDFYFITSETIYCQALTSEQAVLSQKLTARQNDSISGYVLLDSHKIPVSNIQFFEKAPQISLMWISFGVTLFMSLSGRLFFYKYAKKLFASYFDEKESGKALY